MIISWKISSGRGYFKDLKIWYYFLFYWILLFYNWIFIYFNFLNYQHQICRKRWVILSSPKCHKIGRYKILQATKLYKYIFLFKKVIIPLNIGYFIGLFQYLHTYNMLLNFNLGYLYAFNLSLPCIIYRYICVNIYIIGFSVTIYYLYIFFHFVFFNFFFDWYRYFLTSYVFYGFGAEIFSLNSTPHGPAGRRCTRPLAMYCWRIKTFN